MASPHPRAEPFRAALDIETLGDLALRLGTARLAPGTGRTWERGAPGAWLAELIAGWRPGRAVFPRHQLGRARPWRPLPGRGGTGAPGGPAPRSVPPLPPTVTVPPVLTRAGPLGPVVVLLALAGGGLRRGYRRAAGVPRPIIAGHLALAVAGLGTWIGFVATGAAALAWVAVGVILSVAGLGMATLAGGLPEPAPDVARPVAIAGAGSHGLRAEPGTGTPAGRPVIMIVVHGTLAASTILLVVLAAVGAG